MIAVTGGLGSGKSSVSKILAYSLDACLIDTDALCRQQMEPGAEGFQEIKKIFGLQFIQPDGFINRELLRRKVFSETEIKLELESILHPIVSRELLVCREECSAAGRFLVVEVPLLFEVGWQKKFDFTIAVYAPRQLCIDRVMLRDNLPNKLICMIISSQMDLEEKRRQADFCIDNSGTYAGTMQQIFWCSRNIKTQKKTGQ